MTSDPTPRFVTDDTLPRTVDRLTGLAAKAGVPLNVFEIGQSRSGRPLFGLVLGSASRTATLTAGAHADEPAGPMAALALADHLLTTSEGRQLLAQVRLVICPQVNPDGAAANSSWFADPADPLHYFRSVVREGPGDDIEFGYPPPDSLDPMPASVPQSVRPENFAVARFLAGHGPVVFHASLHGMAVAEGAWFLIGANWINRTARLRELLDEASRAAGLPLHDLDRHGDKGFFRIGPGFCTTPTSAGMRDHFLAAGDPATAELFLLNSMEFTQSLGGDPLVMVSELPLFLIGNRPPADAYTPDAPPPPVPTPSDRFRAALQQLRRSSGDPDPADVSRLAAEHQLRPLPFAVQVDLIRKMVLEGLRTALHGT